MSTGKTIIFDLKNVELKPMDFFKPAAWNPRIITDKRFKKLVESIKKDPQFLTMRPILCNQDGIIYAGNMRYRALQELGVTAAPCIVADIDEKTAVLRSLTDNNSFGEYQMDELASLVVQFDPMEIEIAGMPEIIMEKITAEDEATTTETKKEVQFEATKKDHTCPACKHTFPCKE